MGPAGSHKKYVKTLLTSQPDRSNAFLRSFEMSQSIPATLPNSTASSYFYFMYFSQACGQELG